MKVIVPMAGRGSRYTSEGYITPKPLIEIKGKAMFLWALESLNDVDFDEIIFIVLKEHENDFSVSELIKDNINTPYVVHFLEEVLEGQLCTVLSAKKYFTKETDILIISSDSWVISNIGEDIRQLDDDTQGLISVMDLAGEQWSFVKTDAFGRATQVEEKVRISNHASTGLYYFRNSREFINYSEEMLRNDERTKGEFYVIPVYQKMINGHSKILLSNADEIWDLGTPNGKLTFEQSQHFK